MNGAGANPVGRAGILDAQVRHWDRFATIGEMLPGIVHELSQPLYAIQNYAQAIIYGLSNSAAIDRETLLTFARQIAIGVERAGGVAGHLRAFGSKSDPCPAHAQIGEIVNSAVELVRPDLRRKQAGVQTDLAGDAAIVFADRESIVLALVILLKNACDAYEAPPPSEGRISIGTRPADDFIQISVRDEGVGLPEVDPSTLFEPFFTTKPDSLGLGLSVCRSIVEAARGRLWAEANHPRGSIFHFTLPRGPEVRGG